MFKVIKHGDDWPSHREAWYGKQVACKGCGCQFEITEKTQFRHDTGRGSAGYYEARVTCPECGITENRLRWR
jgi:hypothetical protein